MARDVRTTDERAYCPHCGADLGPAQNEGVTVRCRLEEALRGMMEATEAVDEWKSGEAPSFLGGYAFDLVKAARTKAREVLSDASPTDRPPD